MDIEKVREIVTQLLSLQEELKQKQEMLDNLKEELTAAMNGELFVELPQARVKLYAYDQHRLSKDKLEELAEKSKVTPVSIDMDDVTSISDVSYYRVLPNKEDD